MANETLAFDLDLFDNTKNGYTPVEVQKKRQRPAVKVLRANYQSPKSEAMSEKVSTAAAIKACSFALMVLMIVSSLLYFRVMYTEKQIELDYAKAELAATMSEKTTLGIEYSEWLSLDRVEEFAKQRGMVKRENYQVRFFDLSGSDGAALTQ